MGKKKANRGRKLRPLLEAAIRAGEIFVREKSPSFYDSMEAGQHGRNVDTYEVCIGADTNWFDTDGDFNVPVMVHVDGNGEIEWNFVRNRDHVLDRSNAEWFGGELEEIMVMHKLGGFTSGLKSTNYSSETLGNIWRYTRKKKRK